MTTTIGHVAHGWRVSDVMATDRPGVELPSLTVVVPTKNEADNVDPLLRGLSVALADVGAEVIFVDDSDDDTRDRIFRSAVETSRPSLDVRLIARDGDQRTGGLSGAVIDGLAAARSRWVCVMDGDLQHPPELVGQLVALGASGDAELVVASRYQPSASNAGLDGRRRRFLSSLCGRAARGALGSRLVEVTDPMSGFFLVDKQLVDVTRLRPRGFKILLELIASHPELRVAEVPFEFGPRHTGQSKASMSQGWAFGRQLIALRRRARTLRRWCYDIHGLITVESDGELPELEKFAVRRLLDAPTLTVRFGSFRGVPNGESIDVRDELATVSYRERSGFGVSLRSDASHVEVTVSRFVARSPHVMYTNVVEPILRWRLVQLGYALVHAACFSTDSQAFLVTAKTDTGKTTTMLKMLDSSPLEFLSDDLVIVAADGVVQSFPKPLTISAHTVHALKDTSLTRWELLALKPQSRVHSREGRRFAFLLTKYRLPVASINAVIQRIVPPPKYHVERLVPNVRSARSASIAGMFIIARGGDSDEALDHRQALDTLLANCADAFGFPPYDSVERLLLATADIDLRTTEREIISAALSDVPARMLHSDSMDWAERLPRHVGAWAPAQHTSAVTSGVD